MRTTNAPEPATPMKIAILVAVTIFVVAAVCTRAEATFYSDTVLADNPVSYWRLNESSGTTATDSTGVHSGTYTNGPMLGQPGPPLPGIGGDTAVRFDGSNDYVSLPTAALIDGLTNVSVEAWIKPETAFATSHRAIFYTSTAAGSNNFVLQSNITSGPDLTLVIDPAVVQASLPLVADKWAHVVGTYDGSTMRVYIDGVLMGSSPHAGAVSDIGIPKNIGRYEGNSQYFLGTIDEVAIYDQTLTIAQIRAHLRAATTLPEPSTLVLAALGLMGLTFRRRRRSSRG